MSRYGDDLNPEADLIAMHSVRQYLRPNGLLMLAVPVGRDRLYWNSNRVSNRTRSDERVA